MLFIVPNAFPKQMPSTIFLFSNIKIKVTVLAFQAALPFIGCHEASSFQHQKSNSACSSMLPFSLRSALRTRLVYCGAELFGALRASPCMGRPDLQLQAQTFLNYLSPKNLVSEALRLFLPLVLPSLLLVGKPQRVQGLGPKSFAIKCRSLLTQLETSNKCDLSDKDMPDHYQTHFT